MKLTSSLQQPEFIASIKLLRRRARSAATKHLALWLKDWLKDKTENNDLFEHISERDFVSYARNVFSNICRAHTVGAAQMLQAQSGDFSANDYMAYHVMLGGTPPPKSVKQDFPNGYSLRAFLERIMQTVEPAMSPEAMLASDGMLLNFRFGKLPVLKELCMLYGSRESLAPTSAAIIKPK